MSSDRFKVVITDYDYPDIDIETRILSEVGATVVGAQCKSEDELIAVASDADAILVQYSKVFKKTISHLEKCKVIARYGIGVDIVDVKEATERGILCTNVAHYCEEEVADHAVSMFLTLTRRLREYHQGVLAGRWHWAGSGAPIHRLRGQTIGVVGFGKIGSAIAARLLPFGVNLAVFDPYADAARIAAIGARKVSFEELVAQSDAILIQAPLTPETRHMFDAKAFAAMKPSAYLINTARGPIIDNAALYEALTTGKILGAALDDTEEEPAKVRDWKPTDKLLHLPNVLVTPHAAYYSEESIQEARHIAASEAARVLSGVRPQNIVNPQVLTQPNSRNKY